MKRRKILLASFMSTGNLLIDLLITVAATGKILLKQMKICMEKLSNFYRKTFLILKVQTDAGGFEV